VLQLTLRGKYLLLADAKTESLLEDLLVEHQVRGDHDLLLPGGSATRFSYFMGGAPRRRSSQHC